MLTLLKSFEMTSEHFWSVLQPIMLAKTRNFRRAKSVVHEQIGEFVFIWSFMSGVISCETNYIIKRCKPLSIVWIRCSNREICNIFNLINAHLSELSQVWRVFSFHSSKTSKRNRLATIKRFNSLLEMQQKNFFCWISNKELKRFIVANRFRFEVFNEWKLKTGQTCNNSLGWALIRLKILLISRFE